MTYDEYLTAWSALHGGYDPGRGRVVTGWLRVAYVLGIRLTRRGVTPGAVTTAGLLLCLAVPAAASAGRWGLLAGAVLVLVAALADGLDGAVAVLGGRVSPLGYVYDSVADRVGELAWLAALWLAGAPGWLVVAGGAASWLHEYLRARAASAPGRGVFSGCFDSGFDDVPAAAGAGASTEAAAGVLDGPADPAAASDDAGPAVVGSPDIGAVTVAERPTRVSLTVAGLLLTSLFGTSWAAPILTVTAAAWLVLSLIGFGHLAVVLRRSLAQP